MFLRSGCWRRHFAELCQHPPCEQKQTTKMQDSYLRLVNGQTGEERVERGPAAARPDKNGTEAHKRGKGARMQKASDKLPDWPALCFEVVVPMPVETAPEGKQKAVYVDSQTAVKVLNRQHHCVGPNVLSSTCLVAPPHVPPEPSVSGRQSGQQRLDTTQGVFIPLPYERILETQRKILVLPHQDGHGQLVKRRGKI